MIRHNLILFLPESTALSFVSHKFVTLDLLNPPVTLGVHAEEVTYDVAWNQAYEDD